MCCSDLALSYVQAHASWREANARPSLKRDRSAYVETDGDGAKRASLAVEGVHCAGCLTAIERELNAMPGVASARLNFTDRRLAIVWRGDASAVDSFIQRLDEMGYRAYPFDRRVVDSAQEAEMKRLVRALAVAGFASMNVMLLAVSVWAGNVSDMTPETRDFFHWIEAAIALPASAYAGRIFYEGAIKGLRGGRITMDFPITLGVVLALAVSLIETARHAEHAYFDSAIMLLFFLLIGRAFDQAMRRRTKAFAENLAALRSETASRIFDDGSIRDVPVSDVRPGDRVLVRPGERVAVDGCVEEGASEIDQSLATGETAPASARRGDQIYAGSLNGDGALTIRVSAVAEGTLLDKVEKLVSGALEGRSRFTQLADRAARYYAPLVHIVAAATLVGWLFVGGGWHTALLNAVAVLIVTCPCAFGLAIPAVQVVATGALFREGVLLNSGGALERFSGIDTVVFDKTGTLTLPEPALAGGLFAERDLAQAARLALSSRHPMAGALAAFARAQAPVAGAQEAAGLGVRARLDSVEVKLGSPSFCNAQVEAARALANDPEASAICYRRGDEPPAVFLVRQALRSDASEVVSALHRQGLRVVILSGDRAAAVAAIARQLGVDEWSAELTPADKIARVESLTRDGRKVLMVGDGLNDAPALAAATASLSPTSAAHVSQAAADALFMGRRLAPVLAVLAESRKARRLMMQNLWLSGLYNLAAIPLAAVGLLTPLIAALAMSSSSLLVTANALRARAVPLSRHDRGADAAAAAVKTNPKFA
ncbi:heavy metal translocating P-type ATPase [Terrarubrum flagellatum]|uniref:heavy metal translocating P-type ATPase n=1 Tax=Terrirubrum flagellatum TaxID=2895980 RepID=UPI0031454A69